MSKRQTRKSISVRGITYQRLKNWCERNGQSISSLVEELANARMHAEGEPVPDKVDKTPSKPPVNVEAISSQHFTF